MEKTIKGLTLLRKITEFFICVVFTFFVLFTGKQGYIGIFTSKFNLFSIIFGGYVSVVVLLILELLLVGQIKFSLKDLIKSINLPRAAVILYMIFTWVSAFVSPYFPKTIMGASRYEGAFTITLYCLTFIFVSYFGRAKKYMIYIFSATTFLLSVLSIIQLHGFNPFMLYPEGYNYFDANVFYGAEFLGTLGNTDIVASFFSLAIPIMFLSLIRMEDKNRFFIVIPLVTSLYVILKMWVLSGIVGVFLGLMISLPFSLKIKNKQKWILFLIIVLLMVLGLFSIYFSNTESGMVYEIKEIMHGNIDGDFGSGRIHIWKEVFGKIGDNLFFGTGPDTMIYENITPFSRYDENLGQTILAKIDIAHNDYLNVLFHQGLFAFVSYFAFVLSLIIKLIKLGGKDRITGIFGGAITCYLIQIFFAYSSCLVSSLFWIISALMIKGDYIEEGI